MINENHELTVRLNGLTKKPSAKELLKNTGIIPQQKIDKILIILLDGSSSMHMHMEGQRKDDVAWKVFSNDLAPNLSGWTYGILIFDDRAWWKILPTNDPTVLSISKSFTDGETSMGLGLQVAWQWTQSNAKQARFIMLTDGEPTDMGKSSILTMVELNKTIPIDTVGIGKGTMGYDPDFLREISRITGGIFVEVGTIKLLAETILRLSPSNRPLLGLVSS